MPLPDGPSSELAPTGRRVRTSAEHALAVARIGDVLELEEHRPIIRPLLKPTRIIGCHGQDEKRPTSSRRRRPRRCRRGSSRCWPRPGGIPESDSDEWAYEIKWDGIRALGYADQRPAGRMLSRRLEDVTARYPELAPIAEAARRPRRDPRRRGRRARPEGRPRFQLIQSRMGLTSPAAVKARAAADAGGLRDLRPPPPRRALRPGPPLRRAAASCSTGSASTGPAGGRLATAATAAPTCSRRRAGRVSRASSRSAATAPTGRASAAGSGSRRGSGAARSS